MSASDETRCNLVSFEYGKVAYIRETSAENALKLFPDLQGLPDVPLIAVHAANGDLIAIMDTMRAALRFIITKKLEQRSVH